MLKDHSDHTLTLPAAYLFENSNNLTTVLLKRKLFKSPFKPLLISSYISQVLSNRIKLSGFGTTECSTTVKKGDYFFFINSFL